MGVFSLFALACVGVLVLLVLALVVAIVLVARQPRHNPVTHGEEQPWRRAVRAAAPPTALRWCPECGAGLPDDAPEGLCPQCLLKGAIGSARDKADSDPAQQTAA